MNAPPGVLRPFSALSAPSASSATSATPAPAPPSAFDTSTVQSLCHTCAKPCATITLGALQVWFDLEPFDGGAQQVLRGWGFFALRPAHVPDENGSGVVTVQCATLESFVALAAAL